MRTEVIDITGAVGKLLGAPIFHPSGKKLLAKGRLLSEEDVRLLSLEGHREVSIAVLDAQEVAEDEAALQVAAEAGCGSMEVRLSAGGRANLMVTEPSCLLIDEPMLKTINQSGAVTMATLPNFSYAPVGARAGVVKSPPFGVPQATLEGALRIVREQGSVMQARPIRNPTVAVLYSDPLRGERARTLFEGIMRTRLERFGTTCSFVLSSVEQDAPLARSLEHLLRARPTVVLIASTTSPAGPEDTVGRAMRQVGCEIESFLAPVEPGNLLLLSYIADIPVVAAPGCFRSPKPNVVDLILPPLLAQYRLTASEISTLGHGGLLH